MQFILQEVHLDSFPLLLWTLSHLFFRIRWGTILYEILYVSCMSISQETAAVLLRRWLTIQIHNYTCVCSQPPVLLTTLCCFECSSFTSEPINGCIDCIYRLIWCCTISTAPPGGLAPTQINNNRSLVPVNKDCQRALISQTHEDLLLSLWVQDIKCQNTY